MNKKKKTVILLIGIIVLIIIAGIYILYKVYTDGKAEELRKDLSKEHPIVFSADLYDGGKGTYRYYPVDGKMEKFSDYMLFYPQYSDDRKKILGFIWEGEYNGLVELNLTDNVIVQIIGLDEIKTCVGRVEDIYDVENYIINPKYYKDGYTFYFGGEIYFLYKREGDWQAKSIIYDECKIDNYHMDSDNKILIEGCYMVGEEGRCKVSICDIKRGKEKIIFDTEPIGRGDNDGIMDVSKDGKLIAYYEKKHILVYNRKTGEKKYVARPKVCDSYLLDLKFSQDNRYIFYTIVEVGFFSSDYIYNFYVVDTESKTKIHLKRWKNREDFYGFEW